MLALAAAAALLWANLPGTSSYASFWGTTLEIRIGSHVLAASSRSWVDEGLMTIFFLVVGLEANRELAIGELRQRSRVAIPVIAAVGGILVAVATYLAFNAAGNAAHGWGVAMSTDTALALGALAIAAPGATRLRVFLLTLVVVDDLVGLLVIAFLYTSTVSLPALGAAAGLFAVLIALRFLRRGRGLAASVVSVGMWLAMFKSGIDPVIVGLAIGLVTSAYPPERGDLERAIELARSFREQPTPQLAQSAQRGLAAAISPNELLQHRLHPWSSYVIVPMFALANIGVRIDARTLSDAVRSRVTIGIFLAYVVGKPAGVFLSSWLGSRRLFGATKLTVTWPGLAGIGAVAGTGFTVSLLVAHRAFDAALLADAQLGLLAALLISPVSAAAIFSLIRHLPAHVRARQFGRTAGELIDLSDDVDPAVDHVRGAMEAPVTLVEYADFECPYCGRAEPVVRELFAESGEHLRYVFRHLPLPDVHPWALLAAEAAEAAAAQGRFWEMHDLLYEHQGELSADRIRDCAVRLGLEMERFERELDRGVHQDRVQRDVESADASGVSGTPTFFINGRRHHGAYDIETLTRAVHAARRTALVAAA